MITPLLSYIVLSYNYQDYVGQTIRSILEQTVQDFEIVVVDDASKDASREVVASFADPRIRLLVNDRNLGGAQSYNRAVSAACGEWLVNLDADDWIAPQKSAAQLEALTRDPTLDIIGTHLAFVDADGNPHPQREVMEAHTNIDADLNQLDNWIGRNSLCRSSTMVRRTAHLRIGLDDPAMIRAPDYELWTRALRHGCRFGLVPEALTYYRLHARGVTYGDRRGTFLELSYAMLRNLVPLAEARALWPSFTRMLAWVAEHEELALLTPGERYRLLGSMMMRPDAADYAGFIAALQAEDDGNPVADAGRRCLALMRAHPLRLRLHKLESDNLAFMAARDWWHEQSDRWEVDRSYWHERAMQLEAVACGAPAGAEPATRSF
jgi:glycosyltransferase involved in cell wall biosynthesis